MRCAGAAGVGAGRETALVKVIAKCGVRRVQRVEEGVGISAMRLSFLQVAKRQQTVVYVS